MLMTTAVTKNFFIIHVSASKKLADCNGTHEKTNVFGLLTGPWKPTVNGHFCGPWVAHAISTSDHMYPSGITFGYFPRKLLTVLCWWSTLQVHLCNTSLPIQYIYIYYKHWTEIPYPWVDGFASLSTSQYLNLSKCISISQILACVGPS